MGILVEWASWWNWHLGGTGILPVSCLFPSGQDAHSTPIHSTIQQLQIFVERDGRSPAFSDRVAVRAA
ncbi:hypothetical protein [Moorena sp. SIO3H5]|uniref:hypothetical protein n=1 Tax=Moorena sp. SIO3H5 TaxID=2607834 RepID=UPI0013BE5F9B|nr:hypothetical protein [Moorena sp. SIO3H5]NEO69625.1 hypothetical protein [Moorena sp. SIO3H5]